MAQEIRRMKCIEDKPYVDPEKAARRLLELANAVAATGRPHPHREDQLPIHRSGDGQSR